MNIYWKFHNKVTGLLQDDDLIEIAIVAKTKGWLAIGLDFNKTGMTQADCYIGFYDQTNSRPVLYDFWLPGKSIPKNDSLFLGQDDILQLTGSLKDGTTTLKFLRKIDTGDIHADHPIRNRTIGVSYAFNINTIDVTQKHTTHGDFFINFVTQKGALNLAPAPLIQFHIIATASVAILMAAIGLSYTFISMKEKNRVISLVFHTKFTGLIKNPILGSIFNPILELTIGEITLILFHLMLTAVWFCFGFFNSTSANVGKGFAYAIIINLTATILPITRYSAFVFVFGISFERAVKYHKWVARLTLLIATIHGILMTVHLADNGSLGNILTASANDYILFGLIAWIAMVIMTIFALEPIRRKFWELFKVIHIILAPVVLVMSSIHAKGWERTLPVLGIAMGLLVIDHLLRIIFGYIMPTKVIKMEYEEKTGITTMVFEKPTISMWYMESLGMGKFVYVYIPGVSFFQSHPFTISSYSKLDSSIEFTCHVKNLGRGWTKKLADFAMKRKYSAASIFARVEGPYGKLSVDLNTYSTVVLIAGGIGVTPINAIYNEITSNKVNASKQNIYVLWTMKDEHMIQLFPNLTQPSSQVKQSFYITGENHKQVNESDTSYQYHYNMRPNFGKFFHMVSETVGSDNSVAVVVCGPTQMNVDVYNAARRVGREERVNFHVHRETFEL
ncbi:predicted protein [Naegleria gruberi]|uniref:Predicted protein n=1 Tax=Naegleria gruberi TaxID=5762 RepID=D2VSJ1_NAEGR|nr:uncharacterized protein NAEGRDRAFT_51918 [Naegleria gruberi]EFC40130.1 predicted protein [Naegleria gruberi]|eukprot:XP_002672874.1 predicted protein [Naegleria gruberi strain NEG-M]